MIKGVGIDIVELDRIKQVYEKFPQKFINKVLTKQEQYCMNNNRPCEYIGGRFAGKEAVAKALGSGIGQVSWQDIEILSQRTGQPYVNLFGAAQEKARKMNSTQIFISISHSKSSAIAQVIMCDIFPEHF